MKRVSVHSQAVFVKACQAAEIPRDQQQASRILHKAWRTQTLTEERSTKRALSEFDEIAEVPWYMKANLES